MKSPDNPIEASMKRLLQRQQKRRKAPQKIRKTDKRNSLVVILNSHEACQRKKTMLVSSQKRVSPNPECIPSQPFFS
jgi:hypothetical protein